MSEESFTRQLATIVCIDAVGFSRMMGIDEERTLSALENRHAAITQICESFAGRTFGAAGDSIMVEFGSPIDSLRAAFEFQDEIARLNENEPDSWKMAFRVGINTGDAIVRGDLLFGDDVNIAARLQEISPGGGLTISDTTYEHVRGKSAATFTFLGEKRLKHIAYPIGAYTCRRLLSGAESGDSGSPVSTQETVSTKVPGSVGPPAIAVLPFRNITSDLGGDFIADGISGDIAAGLANIRWLPVISRSSTFQFRDENLDAISAGKTLGAGYVVSGTIACDGTRLRLNATLEDVAAARTVWTRRYDRKFSSLLELQDELGSEIVSMLEQQVDRAEQARTFKTPWEDLDTWQLVRRGRWHMQKRTSEDTKAAIECFEKALKDDPNSSATLNEIAWWYFWRAWLRLGDPSDLGKVEKYSMRALYMDSQDARPHAYLGACEIMRKRPGRAVGYLQEAIRIDPSFAFAYSALGSSNLLLGIPEKAVGFFKDAERLSPFDIYQFHNLGELASAQFHMGMWEEAIDSADRSIVLSPRYFLSRLVKIGSLASMDRIAEAKTEITILNQRLPEFTLERMEWIPYVDASYNRKLITAFEKALNHE